MRWPGVAIELTIVGREVQPGDILDLSDSRRNVRGFAIWISVLTVAGSPHGGLELVPRRMIQ